MSLAAIAGNEGDEEPWKFASYADSDRVIIFIVLQLLSVLKPCFFQHSRDFAAFQWRIGEILLRVSYSVLIVNNILFCK